MRPATLNCKRDAALSRLTSVLPSSSARTFFNSSATLSNSASRSSCCLIASSILAAAGGGPGLALGRSAAAEQRGHGQAHVRILRVLRGRGFAVLLFLRRLLGRFLVNDFGHRNLLLVAGCRVAGLALAHGLHLTVHAPFSCRRRCCPIGGLSGLLEKIGHRRHAVAGNVFEDLQHLGPLFQMADAELGIAHRLLDEVFARPHQVRQAAGRWPHSAAACVLDAAASLRLIELLRRTAREVAYSSGRAASRDRGLRATCRCHLFNCSVSQIACCSGLST